MYVALESGQITVSKRIQGESNPGGVALITDSDGRVLMTVESALEIVEKKKKQGVHKAAERAVARAQAVDKRADAGAGSEESGDDHSGDGCGNQHAATKLSRTASADPIIAVAKGSRKRLLEQGDNANGSRKKRLPVKSAEFIEDSDESISAGPSLPTQDMTSRRDILQHPRLSVDSGTAVGTPLGYATQMVLPDASTTAVFSPPITSTPVLPITYPIAPVAGVFDQTAPFPMIEDAQFQNWDLANFPMLDPLILQGPDFEELVEQFGHANSNFG